METNFEKIEKLISQSTLGDTEQAELIDVFRQADDADLQSVVELFMEDSSWITFMHENYKAKLDAFKSGGADAWKTILEKEEEEIEKMSEEDLGDVN